MPDSSDDYQLPSWPPTPINRDLWNAVMGSIAGRLTAREELEADFEALIAQGTQASLDYIQATVAPQIATLQASIGLAQDQIDQIVIDGISPDAAKLGGQLPAHYATAQALADALEALSKDDVGLGSVDNTPDTEKPVSGPQAAALELLVPLSVAKWLSKGIGELYAVFDQMAGADIPPTDDVRFRYIKLSAGLTGAGSYNNGILTSEVVSGSSPTISATAVISLADSPLNGQAIRLINTERRFLRAGDSGAIQDSMIVGHNHAQNGVADFGTGGTAGLLYNAGSGAPYGPIAGTVAGGDETRPRNIGISYYLRIK